MVESKENALERNEYEELISACKSVKEKLMIIGLTFTGMRCGEFQHLKEDWISWQDKIITIPSKQECNCYECKTKRKGVWNPKTERGSRKIPIIEARLETILKQWFTTYKSIDTDRTSIFRIVKRIACRTQIKKKVYPHSLRSTFASILANQGMAATTIQYVMGWKRFSTAEIYVQASGIRAIQEMREKWKV